MKQNQRATFADLCLGAILCLGMNAGYVFAEAGDPGNAAAPVAPVTYRSPFADYRVLGDDRITPWQDANDTVQKIGGWRAYAKEAAEAAKAGAAKPTPPPTPAAQKPVAPGTPVQPTHKHGG